MRIWNGGTQIGIDVGPRRLAAAQLERSGKGWRVRAAALLSRSGERGTPEAGEIDRLRDVLLRRGFTGRRIALAVPSEKLLAGSLELPPRGSGAPIEQLARMELGRAHKREPMSLELACWDVPAPARGGAGTHVMAAACAYAEADALLDAFEDRGWEVVALDSRSWAMARAVGAVLEGVAMGAALEVGEQEVLVAIVHGGVVVYERLLRETGLAGLRTRLCQQLGVDGEVADHILGCVGERSAPVSQAAPEEASALIEEYTASVVDEVRASFSYVAHRYGVEVERLVTLGAGASAPGLGAALTEALGVETRTGTGAELFACSGSAGEACRSPELTVALGLARWTGRQARCA